MTQQRPAGITVLAILALISGAFVLFLAFSLLSVHGIAALGLNFNTFSVLGVGLGILFLLGGALQFAFGVGLMQLRPWALALGVIAQVVTLLTSVIDLITGIVNRQNGVITSQVIDILLAGSILYYLNTPRVQSAFQPATHP